METWRKKGACRDANPIIFFPISYTGSGREAVAEAKAICTKCLVQPQCMAAALDKKPATGIWGSMTPDERTEEIERRKHRGK
jgi:WhiB family transcriptional regulator, redox-sensing transcriptional regulator